MDACAFPVGLGRSRDSGINYPAVAEISPLPIHHAVPFAARLYCTGPLLCVLGKRVPGTDPAISRFLCVTGSVYHGNAGGAQPVLEGRLCVTTDPGSARVLSTFNSPTQHADKAGLP